MRNKSSSVPTWRITNGWREVFARIFENFQAQFNLSPEWLINPSTNRRLKLDMLYPDIGVAIRFEGMQGKKQQRRPSLQEEVQQQARYTARLSVSRQHGIHLILVDLVQGKPQIIFKDIDLALSRARQKAKPSQRPKITEARTTAASLARRINSPEHLKLYADLWQDRHYRMAEPAQPQTPQTPIITYNKGMEVEHTMFGPGVVLNTTPSNGDTLVTVDFVTAGQKTLAASLIADKLFPR